MRKRCLWPLVLLVCFGCGDDSSAPPAGNAFAGGETVGGGRGVGAGGTTGDAGASSDGATANTGGACSSPRGVYVPATSTPMGECDGIEYLLDPTIVYTMQHMYTPSGAMGFGLCTAEQSSFSAAGCTLEQSSRCSFGREDSTTCTLDAAAEEMACDLTVKVDGHTCIVQTTFKRAGTPGACDAPRGVYRVQRTITRGSAANNCQPEGEREQIWNELLSDAPQTSGCSWAALTEGAACSLRRDATCPDNVQEIPSFDCTFNEGATEGSCDVNDGPCGYRLELVR